MNIEVELKDWMGSDRSIAEAAWTSTFNKSKAEKRSDDDVARVINLLANEQHGVPFEVVYFSFWIKLPITADRQLVKHRIASHSGASGRYRTMPEEWLAFPEDCKDLLEKVGASSLIEKYNSVCKESNTFYRETLKYLKELENNQSLTNKEYKRLREIFRGVLPQNNMTFTVFTMNLRSFANFQKLRNSSHAQPEIRYIAEQMLEAIENAGVAPLAVQALKNNNWII